MGKLAVLTTVMHAAAALAQRALELARASCLALFLADAVGVDRFAANVASIEGMRVGILAHLRAVLVGFTQPSARSREQQVAITRVVAAVLVAEAGLADAGSLQESPLQKLQPMPHVVPLHPPFGTAQFPSTQRWPALQAASFRQMGAATSVLVRSAAPRGNQIRRRSR